MARILTRSNRPIVIQEAQSGMDMLLSEVSKYVSPEYQQQRKENERADARFQLQVNAAQENKDRYQDSLAQQDYLNDFNKEKQNLEVKKYKTMQDRNAYINGKEEVDNIINATYPSSKEISELDVDSVIASLSIDNPSAMVKLKPYIKSLKKQGAIIENSAFSLMSRHNDSYPNNEMDMIDARQVVKDPALLKSFIYDSFLKVKPEISSDDSKKLNFYTKEMSRIETKLNAILPTFLALPSDSDNYKEAKDNIDKLKTELKKFNRLSYDIVGLNKKEPEIVDGFTVVEPDNLTPFAKKELMQKRGLPFADTYAPTTLVDDNYDIAFGTETDTDSIIVDDAVATARKNSSSNEDIAFDADFIRPTLSKEEFKQEIREGNISDLDDAIYYGMFEKDKVPNWAEKILQTTRAEQKPSLNNKEEMNRLVNQFKEDISTDESTLNEKMPAFLDEPAPQRPYTTPQSSQSEIEGDVKLENLSRFLYSPESVNPLQQSQVVEPPIDKDENKSIEREQKLTSADEYNFKNRQIMNTKSGSPININTAVGLVSKNLNKINKLKNNYNKSKGNKKLILAKGITQEQNKMKELINDYITSDATFKDKKFDENFYNKLSSKLNISISELKKLITFNIGLNI